MNLATDGRDGIEKYGLENDTVGPACKVRNLGEFIQKPGKQKGRKREGGGGDGGEWGVMCYDKIKQNV